LPDQAIYKTREITVYRQEGVQLIEDFVVEETPLTLFLNHTELATMICSPGNYKELGVGFLFSEGLLQDPSEIQSISCREEDGLLWIETSKPIPQTGGFLRRHIASCCGKSRAGLYFINDARQLKPVQSQTQFKANHLLEMIKRLEELAVTFHLTGGVHSAALADHSHILSRYEDIGRHNAVDRILGHILLNSIRTDDKFLLLSGRIASEILIKATRANIPLIVSRSAPTGLTIDLAEEMNIAVVGFARGAGS